MYAGTATTTSPSPAARPSSRSAATSSSRCSTTSSAVTTPAAPARTGTSDAAARSSCRGADDEPVAAARATARSSSSAPTTVTGRGKLVEEPTGAAADVEDWARRRCHRRGELVRDERPLGAEPPVVALDVRHGVDGVVRHRPATRSGRARRASCPSSPPRRYRALPMATPSRRGRTRLASTWDQVTGSGLDPPTAALGAGQRLHVEPEAAGRAAGRRRPRRPRP